MSRRELYWSLPAAARPLRGVQGSRRRHNPAFETRQSGDKRLDLFMSIAYAAIGFSPITALAIAIIGWLPLPVAALLFVSPSVVLGIGLGLLFPFYGKLALKGLLIGLIAVFLYDCMRVPFILAGIWGDFIPKISTWLIPNSSSNWVIGYAWRYLGDGGFMGMAFTVVYSTLKPRPGVRPAALGFGVGIWFCLIGTLLVAPHGQALLFPLTLTTVSLSLLGHLIYGAAIGLVFPSICRESVSRSALWKQPTVPILQEVQLEPIWEQQTSALVG